MTTNSAGFAKDAIGTGLVKAQKENIIKKSLDKIKETSTVCILKSRQYCCSLNLITFHRLRHILINDFTKHVNDQNVLQGTRLLAIDVAAASGLLRRLLIGDELTEKEKQALRRTLTDVVSVVPIGFLMLLPVSQYRVSHRALS